MGDFIGNAGKVLYDGGAAFTGGVIGHQAGNLAAAYAAQWGVQLPPIVPRGIVKGALALGAVLGAESQTGAVKEGLEFAAAGAAASLLGDVVELFTGPIRTMAPPLQHQGCPGCGPSPQAYQGYHGTVRVPVNPVLAPTMYMPGFAAGPQRLAPGAYAPIAHVAPRVFVS